MLRFHPGVAWSRIQIKNSRTPSRQVRIISDLLFFFVAKAIEISYPVSEDQA
jgi:hypothetical protein